MIVFEKVTWRNFLSFGDQATTVDLSSTPKTLIIGENGNGKSTLLDAICYGLFGKPYRNIKKGQLINSINQKNCLVEIEFTIGTNHYKVIRGMSPNIFEIYQNEKLYDQSARALDHQKILEENILKLNQKAFMQICILGSANYIPFMQLPLGQRREVIEELLDIRVFSTMKTLVKAKIKEINECLSELSLNIESVNAQIRMKDTHIREIEAILKSSKNEHEADLLIIHNEITQLKSERNKLKGKLLDYADLKKKLEKKRKSMTECLRVDASLQAAINKVKETSKFFEENDHCPTCKQEMGPDHKATKQKEQTERLAELGDGYSQFQIKSKEIETLFRELETTCENQEKILSEIRSYDSLIESKHKQEQGIQNKLSQKSQKYDIEQARKELQSLYEKKSDHQEQKENQRDELTYMAAVQEMLKDTGIKTQIIRQYVPIMNKLINDYLDILDFFVLFTLDENFNETIRSRHRDNFSYNSFSEGQKARINLAILFCWREIARLKNSASTNLLILDETLDSSTDANGIEKMMIILNTAAKQSNIFVISHREVN